MSKTSVQPGATRPSDIAIVDGGHSLGITWQDGTQAQLPADDLWLNCPSAAGRRRRIDGIDQPPPGGVNITGLQAIGHHAVNIAFSDGHDRGVYPWALLRRLGARKTMQDFLVAAPDAGPVCAMEQTKTDNKPTKV